MTPNQKSFIPKNKRQKILVKLDTLLAARIIKLCLFIGCLSLLISILLLISINQITSIFLAILLLTVIYIWQIEPYQIKVNKIKNPITNDLKIGLISDLHLGVFKGERFVSTLIKELKKLNLDLLLIAGDFYYKPQLSNENLLKNFKTLMIPIYAVTGNHDHEDCDGNYFDRLKQETHEAGIELLLNKKKQVKIKNQIFSIIGLKDLWFSEKVNEQSKIFQTKNLQKNEKTILLIHNPDWLEQLTNQLQFDLILAGHTHAGQIRIPKLYKKCIPTISNYEYGYYETKNGPLFVSQGLGEVGLPCRFLCKPEIILFNSSKNNDKF